MLKILDLTYVILAIIFLELMKVMVLFHILLTKFRKNFLMFINFY